MFLSAPRDIELAAAWERDLANVELYERLGGDDSQTVSDPNELVAAPPEDGAEPKPAPPRGLLDATELLPPAEVQKRTGDDGELVLAPLPEDLERTAYYHGLALQAEGRDSTWDITYRVWSDPPEGLDAVIETFGATLPGVAPSAEVTAETYLADSDTVRVVGFVDRDADAAVLLTCGVDQCPDLATAIILAKFVHAQLDALRMVDEAGNPIEADEAGDDTDDEDGPIPPAAYPQLKKPEFGE